MTIPEIPESESPSTIPRAVKPLRITALVISILSLLTFPVAVIIGQLMSSPFLVSTTILEYSFYGACGGALAILIFGTADRIKYHYANRRNENVSSAKFTLNTLFFSALWIVLAWFAIPAVGVINALFVLVFPK